MKENAVAQSFVRMRHIYGTTRIHSHLARISREFIRILVSRDQCRDKCKHSFTQQFLDAAHSNITRTRAHPNNAGPNRVKKKNPTSYSERASRTVGRFKTSKRIFKYLSSNWIWIWICFWSNFFAIISSHHANALSAGWVMDVHTYQNRLDSCLVLHFISH